MQWPYNFDILYFKDASTNFNKIYRRYCQRLNTISSENELCPGPIVIHGLKNQNLEFIKFIRKSNFILVLSEIPQNLLSVCQALW